MVDELGHNMAPVQSTNMLIEASSLVAGSLFALHLQVMVWFDILLPSAHSRPSFTCPPLLMQPTSTPHARCLFVRLNYQKCEIFFEV